MDLSNFIEKVLKKLDPENLYFSLYFLDENIKQNYTLFDCKEIKFKNIPISQPENFNIKRYYDKEFMNTETFKIVTLLLSNKYKNYLKLYFELFEDLHFLPDNIDTKLFPNMPQFLKNKKSFYDTIF